MDNISIELIENAFMPAQEITDADNFAGREDLIKNAYRALLSKGTNIAIFGNRGIGKTSLARQLFAIASGDDRILDRIGFKGDRKLDFLPVYYACGDMIENYHDLLKKLLTTEDCLKNWVYDIPAARKEIEKLNGGFNAGIAKVGGTIQTESTNAPVIVSHDLDVIFCNVINEIGKQRIARDGILVIIDEYDRIKDHEGLAAFLKSSATNIPQVKFCIVGVAQDLQDLLQSHASSDRLFAGGIIFVPPMTHDELNKIIDNAEKAINEKIIYSQDARESMIALSQGHPYIIHLIGKYSLRMAHDRRIKEIDGSLIFDTLNQIASNNADPILESRYRKAVRSSSQREIVLKAFAKQDVVLGDIHTSAVYKDCAEKGIENPSVYVGQLVSDEFGAELIKVRDTYYRFKDSLFKAYAAARPSSLF